MVTLSMKSRVKFHASQLDITDLSSEVKAKDARLYKGGLIPRHHEEDGTWYHVSFSSFPCSSQDSVISSSQVNGNSLAHHGLIGIHRTIPSSFRAFPGCATPRIQQQIPSRLHAPPELTTSERRLTLSALGKLNSQSMSGETDGLISPASGQSSRLSRADLGKSGCTSSNSQLGHGEDLQHRY